MIFKCKNCGGNVVFEPERGTMYCPHCEGEESQNVVQGGSLTQCVNCGAPMQVGDYVSASRCEHCGSYIVFNERVEGVYEPHLVLPFQVSREKAAETLNEEFGKRVFTPAGFLSAKSLEKMQGVYVPFWVYDYEADYTFEGEGTKVRSWRSGDTEYVETSYYEVVRKMEASFDRIPVDASLAMEDGVMDLMEPYDYQKLRDFDPKYLSGFYGEIYNQSASELEGRAQVKARDASEEMMQSSLGGYTSMKSRRKDLNLHRSGVNYVLMPVWEYHYQYQGKIYAFHVNGQTGKVVGKTPVSREKVLSYGASFFAAVTAICYFAVQFLEIL